MKKSFFMNSILWKDKNEGRNLNYEKSQDYSQELQGNCTLMNSIYGHTLCCWRNWLHPFLSIKCMALPCPAENRKIQRQERYEYIAIPAVLAESGVGPFQLYIFFIIVKGMLRITFDCGNVKFQKRVSREIFWALLAQLAKNILFV